MVNFVEIYNSSNSFEEVVARTGLSYRTVQQYAGLMRKKGVLLKKFERKKQEKIDLQLLVSTWNTSTDLKEVIEKTKYSFNTIIRYVSLLRGMGVELRQLRKEKKPKKESSRIALETFIETYNTLDSIVEVAEMLNVTPTSVWLRKERLNKKGYNLKNLSWRNKDEHITAKS